MSSINIDKILNMPIPKYDSLSNDGLFLSAVEVN